jgi:hypothetical protein
MAARPPRPRHRCDHGVWLLAFFPCPDVAYAVLLCVPQSLPFHAHHRSLQGTGVSDPAQVRAICSALADRVGIETLADMDVAQILDLVLMTRRELVRMCVCVCVCVCTSVTL